MSNPLQAVKLKSCSSCGNKFTKGIQCGTCKKYYDLRCANISEIVYRRLEFEGKHHWKCNKCQPLTQKTLKSTRSPEYTRKVVNELECLRIDNGNEYNKSETSKEIVLSPKSQLLINSKNIPNITVQAEHANHLKATFKVLSELNQKDTIISKYPKPLPRTETTQKVTDNENTSIRSHITTNGDEEYSQAKSLLTPLSQKSTRSGYVQKVTKSQQFSPNHSTIQSSETLEAIMNMFYVIYSMLEPLPALINDVKVIKTNIAEIQGLKDDPQNLVSQDSKVQCESCVQMKAYADVLSNYGGIPPLVRLVSHENPEVCRNACGALRNLSYGRQNDENKRAIRDAGGIPALMALLCRATDMEVKELVTGVIWNMSSCEDLKQSIIDDAAQVIVNKVLIPHSGWHPTNPGDTYWSTVFRNSSGVLRNASSAGEYARRRLRSLPGLAEALLHAVRAALQANAIGTKIVENCVCVLRNLSYRCQEIEDPLYDTRAPPTQSSSQARIQASASKGENLGCFGGSKKKKEGSTSSNSTSPLGKSEQDAPPTDGGAQLGYSVPKGTEMLWSPEVVPLYMALLQTCSNPETLEAAAGALQNLAACYWQPSIDIRAAVRKEKGLPILVELLRMEVDRVVCAVATALRNLAIDTRNKELIGKYAMRDLVQKLPAPNQGHDQGTSDDTIAAVLATLNEVIKKSGEFSRSLLEAGGVERLLNLTKQRHRHTARVLKFAGQVLMTMWSHAELREVYRKHGWREADFLTPARAAQPRASSNSSGQGSAGAPHSPSNANSTLSRPMASTGGTRYEDRTIRRHRENDDMPAMDNNYQDGLGMGNPNGRPMNLQGVQAQMPPPGSR